MALTSYSFYFGQYVSLRKLICAKGFEEVVQLCTNILTCQSLANTQLGTYGHLLKQQQHLVIANVYCSIHI